MHIELLTEERREKFKWIKENFRSWLFSSESCILWVDFKSKRLIDKDIIE